MSDRSVEDELIAEVRTFSAAMRTAMQRHAQAANWLDRRKARKQISRLVREERRSQDLARTHQKSFTTQAVDRYRTHAQAVHLRANDPRVDHTRRARDAAALREHRDNLAGMFVTNGHLTVTERGIALDGLDAATVFPEFATGDLFGRAHKVKGIEALHYRARVAREVGGVHERAISAGYSQQQARVAEQYRVEQQQRELVEDALWAQARQKQAERTRLEQIEAQAPEPERFRASVSWTGRDGATSTESRTFGTDHAAAAWMRRDLDHTLSFGGTTVKTETWDSHDDHAPVYSHTGSHRTVAKSLAAREESLARIALAQPREASNTHDGQATASNTTAAAPVRDQGREQVTAERDSLRARLNLSIEHNADLSDQNARSTRQLSALAGERDQLRAEREQLLAQRRTLVSDRDRLLGERDEAVRKLAERTPADQRFGSPQRQAEQARQEARRNVNGRATTRGARRPGPDMGSFEQARDAQIDAEAARQAHEEAVAEHHAAVMRDMSAAYQDGDSELVAQHRARFDGVDSDQARDEFAQWYLHGGQDQYHAEQRQRDEQAKARTDTAAPESVKAEPRSALAGFQPGRALADAVARNGAQRDGTEHDGAER